MIKYYIPISLACSAVLLTACGDDDAAINEAIKGGISVVGTNRVGETLSIESDYTDRNGVKFNQPSYQWYANGTAIDGATEATFIPTNDELFDDVHVKIDLFDDDGFPETLTSDSVNIYYPYTISMVIDRELTMGMKQSTDFASTLTWGATQVPAQEATAIDPNERHYNPSIAADNQGNLVAVSTTEYNSNYGGEYDVVVTRSSDNGATWSDLKLLVPSDTTASESDASPVVATDKNGKWIVVWESNEDVTVDTESTGTDSDLLYVTSVDNGETWSDPLPLNPAATVEGRRDGEPQISINGDEWTVAWATQWDPANTNTNQMDYEIFTMHSSDGGVTWGDPLKVSQLGEENNGDDRFPKMSINETGRGVIVWAGEENGTDKDIYKATTNNFGETWTAGSVLNANADDDTAADHEYPSSVYTTPGRNFVITWYGKDTAATGSDDEAYYSVSINNGYNWNPEVILSQSPILDSTSEFSPNIMGTPDGSWVAHWVDNTGAVYVSKSADLETWDDAQRIDEDSDETVSWLLH